MCNSFSLAAAACEASSQETGKSLSPLRKQRLLQAFRVPGEIKTEPALYAQELFIDAGKVAVYWARRIS